MHCMFFREAQVKWFERVRALTLELVRIPSVTGTPDETAFAPILEQLLRRETYFQAHPDHLRLEASVNDPCSRQTLFALVRGQGRQTVMLTGHYDTVSLDNYGTLKHWALEPEILLPRLIADLRSDAETLENRVALRDLESGDFMPGRAALDMKSGLAAGMAVLEQFSQTPERVGNLLFVVVPDEEVNSFGMRSALPQLLRLSQEWNLDLRAAINMDASSDPQSIYLGSIGKLLPSVYFLGRPTHVSEPFEGVNPNLMAAELTRELECNPVFGDQFSADTAPPASLYQTDLRLHYDVTTPANAWCSFNVLTKHRSPEEVLAQFAHQVQRAMERSLELLRARSLAVLGKPRAWTARVLTYAELLALTLERAGAEVVTRLHREHARLARQSDFDAIAFSQRCLQDFVRESRLEGPLAVVCFASLHYPAVSLGGSVKASRLQAAVQRAVKRQPELCVRDFFPGISDMSFFGTNTDSLESLSGNTPAWAHGLSYDAHAAQGLDVPIINIGPWGSAYHQRLERLYEPYAFETLPELLLTVAHDLLNTAGVTQERGEVGTGLTD